MHSSHHSRVVGFLLDVYKFKTYDPKIIPVANIPIKLGSFNLLHIYPIDIPTIKINEILNNIYPPK